MTTQNIEETESSGALENDDLFVLFRPGQDDEIRKSLSTMKEEFGVADILANTLRIHTAQRSTNDFLVNGVTGFTGQDGFVLAVRMPTDASSAGAGADLQVGTVKRGIRDVSNQDLQAGAIANGAVYLFMFDNNGRHWRMLTHSILTRSDLTASNPTGSRAGAVYPDDLKAAVEAHSPDASDATPEAVGTASAGTSDDFSRSDHVHSGAAGSGEENVQADWDETDTNDDAYIQNKPVIPSAADSTPLAIGTAATGTSDEYAREDHVHAINGIPVPLRNATYSGSALTATITGFTHESGALVALRTPATRPSSGNLQININGAGPHSVVNQIGGTGISILRFPVNSTFYFMYRSNFWHMINPSRVDRASLTTGTDDVPGMLSAADVKHAIDEHGADGAGEENVQADWNEATSTSDAYIQNKPTIPSAASNAPEAVGTAAVGTSSAYAREDHVHSGAAGSGEENVQSDWDETDTNDDSFILNKPTIPSASDSAPSATGTAAAGSSSNFSRSDHVHSTAGEENVQADWNESTSTSDAYIQNKPTIPSAASSAPEDVGTSAVGTSSAYAREDHVHGGSAGSGEENVQSDWNETDTTDDAFILNKPTIPSASDTTPSATGTAGAGSSSDFSRADHVHSTSGEANVQADWNEASSSSDAYIQNKPTIPSAADAAPQDIGTAAVGTSNDYAREDHVHGGSTGSGEDNVQSDWDETDTTDDAFILNKPTIPSAGSGIEDTVVGSSSSGSSADFARADHVHKSLGAVVGFNGSFSGNTLRGTNSNYEENASAIVLVIVPSTVPSPDPDETLQFSANSGTARDVLLRTGESMMLSQLASSSKLVLFDGGSLGWFIMSIVHDITEGDLTTGTDTSLGYVSAASVIHAVEEHSAGEENVQADWNEATSTSDAYIQNKPTIPSADTSIPQGVGNTGAIGTDDDYSRGDHVHAGMQADWDEDDTSSAAHILNKPSLFSGQLITQANYDALSDPDDDTVYFITEG